MKKCIVVIAMLFLAGISFAQTNEVPERVTARLSPLSSPEFKANRDAAMQADEDLRKSLAADPEIKDLNEKIQALNLQLRDLNRQRMEKEKQLTETTLKDKKEAADAARAAMRTDMTQRMEAVKATE